MRSLLLALSLTASLAFSAAPVLAKDEAEIKLPVDSKDIDHAKKELRLDQLPEEARTIYFFDTEKLKLLDHDGGAVVLRARKKGGKKPEITVKFRPKKSVDQDTVKKWEGIEGFKAEAEWIIGKGPSTSYSLERKVDTLGDEPKIGKLISDEQRKFLKEFTGIKLETDHLKAFGPIKASAWVWEEKDPAIDDKEVGAELWDIPKVQLFEISRKAKNNQLDKKAAAFEEFYKAKKIHVDPDPDSKTRKALESLK